MLPSARTSPRTSENFAFGASLLLKLFEKLHSFWGKGLAQPAKEHQEPLGMRTSFVRREFSPNDASQWEMKSARRSSEIGMGSQSPIESRRRRVG